MGKAVKTEFQPQHWQTKLRCWSADRTPLGTPPVEPAPLVAQDLLDRLKVLRRMRDDAAANGDYTAARAAEADIEETQRKETAKQLQELLLRQMSDTEDLEQLFKQEFDQFVLDWDRRTQMMQRDACSALDMLLQRQQGQSTACFTREAATLAAATPKQSVQMLELRKMERTLADQREYDKAKQVRRQIEALQVQEATAHDCGYAARLDLEERDIGANHSKQQGALRQRMGQAQAEALRRQQADLQQLMRRYQAARLALQRAHATQRLAAEHQVRCALGIPPAQRASTTALWSGAPLVATSLAERRIMGLVNHGTGSPQPAPGANRAARSGLPAAGRCRTGNLKGSISAVAGTKQRAGGLQQLPGEL